jgi:pimeloyl-ACP methyl ester carboxylesterase
MSDRIPVIAFVHGCTQGPSGWDRVRELLTVEGVNTMAINLEPRRFDSSGAMECATHIAEALRDLDQVVLVGTSCTGIIVPVVTMVRPIDHLVFICAGLPDIGRSVTDQILQDGVLHSEWASCDAPYGPDAARRFMFNDCDGEVLEWSLTTVRAFLPQPAYDEITPLTRWPDVPSTYVLGTKDRVISQDWAREVVPRRLGVSPLEISTGHCPQNSRPAVLSKLLLDVGSTPQEY